MAAQNTVQVAAADENADAQAEVRMLQLLRSFRSLEQGIEPEKDIHLRRERLSRFNSAVNVLHDFSYRLKAAPFQCRDFVNLYNLILQEQTFYYSKYEAEGDANTKRLIEARLIILRFLNSVFFSQTLANREAGFSPLDSTRKKQCTFDSRPLWKNKMAQAHHLMNQAHVTLLGEYPAIELGLMSKNFSPTLDHFERLNRYKQWSFWGAEALVSIAVWIKTVGPWTNEMLRHIRSVPLGRVANLFVQAAYILAWFKIDDAARDHVDFMKPPPPIVDDEVLSDWSRMISLTRQFLDTKLVSPQIYAEYLQLVELVRHSLFIEFVKKNESQLLGIERQYGSLNTAYHLLEGDPAR